jgi:hypothetical protein
MLSTEASLEEVSSPSGQAVVLRLVEMVVRVVMVVMVIVTITMNAMMKNSQ